MSEFETGLERLTRADFKRVAEFVLEKTGIRLPPAKKIMLEGRLRRRMRALGLETLADYCQRVFDDGGMKEETVHLIDAVTTNKTDFFRERQHFIFLTETLLPELMKARGGCKLWSAACSIGAEPYTLAMVLSEFAAVNCGFNFSILASDISTDVLGKAKRAIYSEDMIEPVPMALRQKYLLRSTDPSKALVRIAPEIRRLVTFKNINLMDKAYSVERGLDVIFCRNLLIYFEKSTQEAVMKRLCQYLRPGGYIFLGHADSIAGMTLPLHWLGNSIYRLKNDEEKDQSPSRG